MSSCLVLNILMCREGCVGGWPPGCGCIGAVIALEGEVQVEGEGRGRVLRRSRRRIRLARRSKTIGPQE